MNKVQDIDKFYWILGGLLLVLALLLIVVLRGIFSAVSVAREVDQEFLESNTPRLNNVGIDRAYGIIMSPQATTLDLKE